MEGELGFVVVGLGEVGRWAEFDSLSGLGVLAFFFWVVDVCLDLALTTDSAFGVFVAVSSTDNERRCSSFWASVSVSVGSRIRALRALVRSGSRFRLPIAFVVDES